MRPYFSRNMKTYFLFVLICPTWPQFAHLRCVPGFAPVVGTGDVGDIGEPPDPS